MGRGPLEVAGSVKTKEEEMKKKRENEEKKKGEMAVAHGCRGKWHCHSLVDRLDDQTSCISREILRKSSTRCEEHSYGGRFHFQRLDC